jgi:hypothetical protein
MTPLKKARKHQELDALVLSVLASYRQQGPMQWTDWHQEARAKRGGKRGLATETFAAAVRRLLAKERVRKDENGCYVYVECVDVPNEGMSRTDIRNVPPTSHGAENPHDAATDHSYEALLKAEIEALRAENKQLLDWIMGNSDALTVLQSVYQSRESSEYSKIKAAVGALPFERPKLSVAVTVRSPALLGERLAAARTAKMKTINPPPEAIEHEP